MPRSTTDYMPLRNLSNDYLIDRQAQKDDTFTGIVGVSEQDAAIQDSMGPIQDRTREHLGPTDVADRRVPQAADELGPRAADRRRTEGCRLAEPLCRARRRRGRRAGQEPRRGDDRSASAIARGYVGKQYGLGD